VDIKEGEHFMERKLPKDFYWGGSVSSFQTEGHRNEGGKGLCVYDVRPMNPEFSDWNDAIDEYTRYDEDIALMRTIPGMTIINPCDDIEAKQAVKAAYEMEGPVYLRFGRLATPIINSEDYKFEIGKGVKLKEGTDVTIVATGLMVAASLEAAKNLEADGINAEVINIHTIKPLDEDIIVESAKKTGKVITVEEHSIIGGLGSAVCDCLSAKYPVSVSKIGVEDVYGHSGPAVELLKEFGLDAEGIYNKIKKIMA